MLEHSYLKIRGQIESELLNQIMESPPVFLERLVVDLVVSMGYGGSRKDAGEALGRSGDEGIFITTSSFSKEALQYVSRINTNVVLIDGTELAKLMFNHGIGVTTTFTYELKNVDSDYFTND